MGAPGSLRDQILQRWGKYGEWNAAGVDRAQELADILGRNNVLDISKFSANVTPARPLTDDEKQYYRSQGYGQEDGGLSITEIPETWAFDFGDGRQLGFLGNANNDGSISKINSGENQGRLAAWSARGKGNVGYNAAQAADGSWYIAPSWGSSSDMGKIRDFAKAALITGAAAYGAGSLLGGGGAGAGAGAFEAGLAGGDAGLAGLFGGSEMASYAAPSLFADAPLAALSYGEVMPALNTGMGAFGGLPAVGVPSVLPGQPSLWTMLTDAASPVTGWVKENPQLARGLFSLAGAALGGGGAFDANGGGGGGVAAGPAKQWATPIQQAIFNPAQQWMPGAIKPGALSMGAGRFLGG